MKDKINSINIGFGNCIFPNRNPKTIEGVISSRINDPKIVVLSVTPKEVKVETIDGLHDKLSLIYDNEVVEGTITWRESVDKQRFVFSSFN